MIAECYAQRLLNPFRGTVHTVKYASAEAVTIDGLRWDIYVANEELLRGLGNVRRAQVSDIRYGSWSADRGLKRGPIFPSDDFRRLEAMGAMVYEHLTQVYQRVPFPLHDRYEYWLLDSGQRPLALLATALDDSELAADTAPAWRAGFTANEHFRCEALGLDAHATPGLNAGEYLARYINRCAGPSPAAQWFRRDPGQRASGMGGFGLAPGLAERTLEADDFPSLYLATARHDERHRQLIEDFLAWQAPWLLTLPLDPPTRRRLEQQSRAQAVLVSQHYRLYPEIIDRDALKATLVEAILRRAQAAPKTADENLTTFYLEMRDNPGPTD